MAGIAWAEDGKSFWFRSNLTGNWEAYRTAIGADAPSWPERATFFGERVGAVRPIPGQPEKALVLADLGGDENWGILRVGPGEVTDLDPGNGILRTGGIVSKDGRRAAFASNRRDRAALDVYVADLTGETPNEARRIWETEGFMVPAAFSPNGDALLVVEVEASKNQRIWKLPLAPDGNLAGQPSVLLAGPPGEETHFESLVFAPDGRTVYAATDLGREFAALAAFDVRDGSPRILASPDADVESIDVSADGTRLAYLENRRGQSVLAVLDLASGRSETWLDAGGVVSEIAWAPAGAGNRILTVWERPDVGLDAYLLTGPGEAARAVTRTWRGGLDARTFAAPEEIQIQTRDGVRIAAWLYRPRTGGAPYPAVWSVHGGPESMARAGFDPVTQFLLAQGLAVVKPNVRGSAGYGRTFEHLDDVRKRLDSVDDLADAVGELVRQGLLDPERQAVMGASYGGYMTLATLTRHPDLWRAGVDIVGIANLVTFLERTSAYRRPRREAEYGSLAEDRAFLMEASPMTHLDRLKAPLLVIHGARDPRVPVFEAEQIVKALQESGRRVEYLRYEDEGHGLTKLANRLEAYGRIATFLAEELRLDA